MKNVALTAGAALLAVGIWFACLKFALWSFGDWQTRGQFGDTFGAANALFTGLAFVALIATLLLQRKDLELQREELRLQREELHRSRVALDSQARAQRLQVLASVITTKVSALEANVEAIKMDSEQFTPGARKNYVDNIHAVATRIDELADTLRIEMEAADRAAE